MDYHPAPRSEFPTNTKLVIARGQRVPTVTRFETWLLAFIDFEGSIIRVQDSYVN